MKKLLLFASALFTAQFSQAQWEEDVRLTDNADSSLMYWGMTHSIAACADTVHVVWYDKSDGNWEIYYMRSTDEGLNWETAIRLTNDPAKSSSPSIAVSGSVVHVVWVDSKPGNREIYYRRSTDGGISWEEEQRLTDDIDLSYGPTISLSGSFVHLAWISRDYEWQINEIHYKHSVNGGATWEPETWLSNYSYSPLNPSITSAGSVVLVAWNDNPYGNQEIFLKRSTDGGQNWEQDLQLTYDDGTSQLPSVAMSGPFVHIVWVDDREGMHKLYYNHSVDGGLNWDWDEDTRITSTFSISPNISLSGSQVSVVWQDYRNYFFEIFYKCSIDGGETWSTDIQLNEITSYSEHPFIAVSGTVLHVVWYDFRDGNFEIYYKRNPTGNLVGVKDDLVKNTRGQVSIFPNPASRQLTVGSQRSAVSGQRSAACPEDLQSAVTLSIVDLYGHEIKEFKDISAFPFKIDISDLRNGIYFLRVTGEVGKSGTAKFLKIAY